MSKAQGIAQSANQGQFKNRIINGAMMIDQRNAGASITVSSGSTSFPVDRMFCYVETGSSGTFTAQQSTTAPAGFKNSVVLTTATADSSIGATEGYSFQHRVEGLNVADLGWGTSNAQSVTLSFWVRSSLTGTFAGSITNGSFNRAYVFNYVINAANTWEQKTVTIAGDTGGTWLTTNGTGLIVYLSIGAGSNYNQTAGSWGSFGYSTAGAVNVIATAGATFYITGVQLEKGSTATSFDYRPYGTELALCQRYAQPNKAACGRYNGSGTTLAVLMPLSPPMRTASPSIVELNLVSKIDDLWAATRSISSGTTSIYNASGTDGVGFLFNTTTTGTANNTAGIFGNAVLFTTEL